MTQNAAPAPRRYAPVAAAAMVAAVGAVSAFVDPTGGPTLCPFRAVTGLDCPLCGATRAAHQLFRGHVLAAMDLNLLFVLVAPVLAWFAFATLRHGFGGRALRLPHLARPTVVAMVVLIAVFTVVRNLGFAPFNWLSTTS